MSQKPGHAPPCSSPRWETWTKELKEEISRNGPMSHREIIRWGLEFGLSREFCRHLIAYADDDLTPLPSKLWTLTPKWIPAMVDALSALTRGCVVRPAAKRNHGTVSLQTRSSDTEGADIVTASLAEP